MTKLRWKRWLYLVHRWFGIALCLLFAAWFVSGVVMMYVGFPQLDRDEGLAGLAVIAFSLGGFALSALGVVVGWRRLRFSRGAPSSVPGCCRCDEHKKTALRRFDSIISTMMWRSTKQQQRGECPW